MLLRASVLISLTDDPSKMLRDLMIGMNVRNASKLALYDQQGTVVFEARNN